MAPLRVSIYKKSMDQKGATTVEFAIVAMLFFALIFGIIDFGLLFYNQQVITNAAREGARFGVVARPDDYKIFKVSIEQRVKDFAESHLVYHGTGDFIPVATFASGLDYCEKFRDVLTMHVTYDYSFFFLPIDVPPLESWTTMICE